MNYIHKDSFLHYTGGYFPNFPVIYFRQRLYMLTSVLQLIVLYISRVKYALR